MLETREFRTQLPVLIELDPLLTSEGTLPLLRGQNHILIKEFVRSIAYLGDQEFDAPLFPKYRDLPATAVSVERRTVAIGGRR